MSKTEPFSCIYQRALERKGGERQLHALLTQPLSTADLMHYTDAQWLEAMTKKIFQSGFVWRVVEQKWPGFRDVFFDFAIEKMVLMSDEMLVEKASDVRIIRNFHKVQTIRLNALFLADIAEEYGSFARMVAEWPVDNMIGLWALLKQRGARLGGNIGPYTLRVMGKDTFLLSKDVEAYFRAQQLIDGGLQSKSNLQKIQWHFNDWQQTSGLPLCQLSQIVAYSVGDNRVGWSTGQNMESEQ